MNPKMMMGGGMPEGSDQPQGDLEARVADLEQRVAALEQEDKQENSSPSPKPQGKPFMGF